MGYGQDCEPRQEEGAAGGRQKWSRGETRDGKQSREEPQTQELGLEQGQGAGGRNQGGNHGRGSGAGYIAAFTCVK